MRCSNLLDGHPCGADIPPSALFCASCGGVVPNSVSSTKPCLQCGNLVTKSQKYCSNCAWKIDQNIFEEVAITCNGEKEDGSTCGTELPKNSKFCPECATAVNNKELVHFYKSGKQVQLDLSLRDTLIGYQEAYPYEGELILDDVLMEAIYQLPSDAKNPIKVPTGQSVETWIFINKVLTNKQQSH